MGLLGIDTGGTFTDFVYADETGVRSHKVLSTPAAPEQAILKGLAEMSLDTEPLRLVHGSTVATNAVLEGKGARVVYITNRGFKDVLTIGRQARADIYELQPQPQSPPVPGRLCLETGGRLSAEGEILEPLTAGDLQTLLREVNELAPEAVAVNLLFSFLDERFEQQIAETLPPHLFVSLSSRVLPEVREYERGIATWLNSYVGLLTQGYLSRLQHRLADTQISVIRSSGETCAAGQAGREAVHLLLSGPAAGLVGGRYLAGLTGEARLITFDMGGTSTDVALIDGDIALTGEGTIGRFPVAVPMVDLHTIGAGGGSIAFADDGGVLCVGPRSAGADPGPACYGGGGTEATVTDANLVLGHLPPTLRLGGFLKLDRVRAVAVLQTLTRQLGLASVEATARGILDIANEHMAQAIRVISVKRGVDPRQLALVAFGGAGGLHVCAVAERVGMRRALAPVHAGVLSALGMLVAPAGRQLTHTVGRLLARLHASEIDNTLNDLLVRGRRALRDQGVDLAALQTRRSLDLCYRGQADTLTLPWGQDCRGLAETFHRRHETLYGHRLSAPIEVVNARVGLQVPPPPLALPVLTETGGRAESSRVAGIEQPVPVFDRAALAGGTPLPGPCIIYDSAATVFVAGGWRCQRDSYGNLLLERGLES